MSAAACKIIICSANLPYAQPSRSTERKLRRLVRNPIIAESLADSPEFGRCVQILELETMSPGQQVELKDAIMALVGSA